ncbi:hypothetical protein BH09BAC1_BH09BAC1_01070 [soil metagenome]
MKVLQKVVAVLLVTCLFVACEPGYTPPPDWQKHENYQLKYTVYYPNGWKLSNQGNPDLLFYVSSPKTGEHDHIQENVNLLSQVVSPETDLATYANEVEKKAGNQLVNLKKTASTEVEFKGFPAIFSTYEAQVNEIRVKWEQYTWLKDDRAYILTYSGDISQFEVYRGLATEIIESFRFY